MTLVVEKDAHMLLWENRSVNITNIHGKTDQASVEKASLRASQANGQLMDYEIMEL
jgi:hypothetical protein